jgi:hypothetical protein
MRRITKIIAVLIIAVIIVAAFVVVVPNRILVSDINTDDATDNVDTDGDGVPNVSDDDIDGDGIPNDEDIDDDGDEVSDDEDDYIEIPNDDENNNGIPDVLEPIVVVKIKDMDFKFAIVNINEDLHRFTLWASNADADYPKSEVVPYTGNEEPVYEWEQTKPLITFEPPVIEGAITIEYWIHVGIQANFNSFDYVYQYPDSIDVTDIFHAQWFSASVTKDVKTYTNVDNMDDLPEDAWNFVQLDSTGRCYLWEEGAYYFTVDLEMKVFFEDGISKTTQYIHPSVMTFEVIVG